MFDTVAAILKHLETLLQHKLEDSEHSIRERVAKIKQTEAEQGGQAALVMKSPVVEY